MIQDVVIDYAYPMMMAEKALKEAHNHLLDKEYDKAIEQMLTALTETKMTLNAIKHMKEQSDALCEQAKAVQERV